MRFKSLSVVSWTSQHEGKRISNSISIAYDRSKKDIVVLICKGDVEHEEVIIPLRIFKDIISCPIRI
jgi:hypothetical protein